MTALDCEDIKNGPPSVTARRAEAAAGEGDGPRMFSPRHQGHSEVGSCRRPPGTTCATGLRQSSFAAIRTSSNGNSPRPVSPYVNVDDQLNKKGLQELNERHGQSRRSMEI